MLWDGRMFMLVDDIFVSLVSLGLLGFAVDRIFRWSIYTFAGSIRRRPDGSPWGHDHAETRDGMPARAGRAAVRRPSWAQTKMTIATGVDPVFSAYYVATAGGPVQEARAGRPHQYRALGLRDGRLPRERPDRVRFGSEIAGVANHNLDPNVVVVAQATRLVRWIAVVGRNVDTLDQLKGKKVGIARGSGGEVFWLAMIDKLKLNPATTPSSTWSAEMVAALERGNIDAYVVWEPWVTRVSPPSRTPRCFAPRRASSSRASTST